MRGIVRMGSVLLVAVASVVVASSGTASAISANPDSVDFGSSPLGVAVTKPVTLTLDQGYELQAAALAGGEWSFDLATSDSCDGVIGSGTGTTCTVDLTFTPDATGPQSNVLTFDEVLASDTSTSETVQIDESGVGVSNFAVRPSSIDFGDVPLGTTVTVPVRVTFDAGYDIGLLGYAAGLVTWNLSFPSTGGCDGFVGPGTCIIDLTFTPYTPGTQSNVWTVGETPNRSFASGSTESVGIDESGDGISRFAVHPSSVNFGNVPVGTTATVPVSVTFDAGYNRGSAIIIEGGLWSVSYPADGGCDGFVGPGTCTMDLTFTPTTPGPQSATWTIGEAPDSSLYRGGYTESVGIDESGDGVTCSAGQNSDLLSADTGAGTLGGLFCLGPAGVGTYTQGAFNGAPSVSGEGVVSTEGETTLVDAHGADLVLAAQGQAGQSPLEGVFEENAPLVATGSFTLGNPLERA
jgi:hypothetical protein